MAGRVSIDVKKSRRGCVALRTELDKLAKAMQMGQERGFQDIAEKTKSTELIKIAKLARDESYLPTMKTIKQIGSLLETVSREVEQFAKVMGE